ncbi:hypothetical protein [Candidatus Tisiphia endosymbiont of Myopa tessellatipennis]|uniref:hypothetical protein n=1 Tax=Candidatus Tisiphia endosymbiont of Myopa tessellatipennis TaxID=3066257 RepID=UPI00313F10A3
MRVLKTKKEYQHIYPPLISKELFDTCQRVRVNWNKKPFKYREKEYIFRGFIKCAVTGRVITADTKQKTYPNGSTAEWIYLLGWHPDNPNKRIYVKEEIILQEVEKVLATLHLDPNLLAEVIAYIKSSAKIEQGFHKMRIGELHAEHTKIKTRMDRLTDLFLDGDISKEDHEGKRQQLIQKREDIVREIESHNNADDKFSERLVNLVELASGALETFKGSNIEKKRKLLNLVFSNLELNGCKLDYTLRPPFDAFVKCTKI